jgi:hypothetical protein
MKTFIITASALALATSLSADLGFSKSTLIANPPVLAALNFSRAATNPPQVTSLPTPDASATVEQLFAEADAKIDASTQDSHEGLSALGERLSAGIKGQVDMWKSQGYTAPLPSDEELSRSLLDFTQKLSALNGADESTWISVKSDTASSLHHLQGVFADLRADSVKKK